MKLLEEEEEKRKKELEDQARVVFKEQGARLRKELDEIQAKADLKLRVEAGRLIDEHLKLLAKDPYHAWQRVFALEETS